jgi:methylated-DNA-[protein]-cysteine S-methyltransferase
VNYTLFDTPLGRCGIAWNAHGIAGLQLPGASESATRAKLLDRLGEAEPASPPPAVQRAIDGINELLRGNASDLAAVPLDMTGVPPFHRRVYETVRTIPPGASLSYGEVAAKAEAPGAARAVGQAMRRNPFSILVPCHRVFAAGGKIAAIRRMAGSRPSCGCCRWKRRRPKARRRSSRATASYLSIRLSRSIICAMPIR